MKNILKNKVKRDILFLIISGIAIILSFANVKLFNLDFISCSNFLKLFIMFIWS